MFRAEHVPIILGVIVALAGLGLIYDAWRPDERRIFRERRRRQRAPRNRPGEALVGLGMILLGAALIGRDTWRLATVSVIAGFLCVLGGAVLNRGYLRELLFFRGPARRAGPEERKKMKPPDDQPPLRIR